MTSANKSLLLAAIVVGAALIIGFVAYAMNREDDTDMNMQDGVSEQETAPMTDDTDMTDAEGTTIEYTDDGYSMDSYTAAPGATVTVVNNSLQNMEYSSDNHPTHRDEPALNTSVTAPGESTTFTAPNEPGEYGFHDHINSQYTGVLIVE